MGFRSAAFIVLLVLTVHCVAQKEYNVRYFGNRAGVSFNGTMRALTDGRLNPLENSTSMCDKDGNLLFYTDGDTVFNRAHGVMKGGVLNPSYDFFRESCFQGTLAIPGPGKDLYYLFSAQGHEQKDSNKYLRYSVIDMSKDGGLGEVINADNPLFEGTGEGVAITRHANGTDYWIASIDKVNRKFVAVRTVNGKIDMTTIVRHDVDPNIQADYMSASCLHEFSPDGTIFKGTNGFRIENGVYKGYFWLYRFDNSTGAISEPLYIPEAWPPLTIEFSPNSRFLYTMIGGGAKCNLVQYDLDAWDLSKILASRTLIYSITPKPRTINPYDPEEADIVNMQLGPGNKIYTLAYYSSFLSIIHEPNEKGKACNFEQFALDLQGRNNKSSGPCYPNFFYESSITVGEDRMMCNGDTIVLECKTDGRDIKWNTGDTGKFLKVTKPGTYSARANRRGKTISDEVVITSGNKMKVYLGQDTSFCEEFKHLLDAGKGGTGYRWNTGDTTITKLVDSGGIYAVTVKDENSCNSADTIKIVRLRDPLVTVLVDTPNCKTIVSCEPQDGIEYLWNTGERSSEIEAKKKGTYTLVVSTLFCAIEKKVNVDVILRPEIDLGPDQWICKVEFVTLNVNDGTSFHWNTGDTGSSIQVRQQGVYSVIASAFNCQATDEVRVWEGCDLDFYIPSAFTPTDDGLNEVFRVAGEPIDYVSMTIVDRWGEIIYRHEGRPEEVFWDGMYKNALCQEGHYFFMIKVSAKIQEALKSKHVKGSVMLLR